MMAKEQGWGRMSRFDNNAAYYIGKLEAKMMYHRLQQSIKNINISGYRWQAPTLPISRSN